VLIERVSRLLRIPATGFAFALLGLGGLCLAGTVFPAIRAITRDQVLRTRRTQATITLAFRLYLVVLQLLGVMRLDVDGRDGLTRVYGTLIVANHPTLLDVVLLMALVPHAQCVVNHALWRNRFLGPVVRAAGYIRNDTEAEAFIGHCSATLAQGNNLIIFPEGTRTVPGEKLRFQRGFANVALRVNVDLLPVRIECNPITLTKGLPWYRVPPRRAAFHVSVGERIAVAPFMAHASRAVGARRLTSFLENYFA
jgi:1-acyl-sn-glycerol-3-phosphate acyltransferase